MRTSKLVREEFIKFFESHGHKLYKPSGLIPAQEDSTMFTIAGMKQFTDLFLGKVEPKDKRIITIQPCLRMGGSQNDIENIGKTTRHNTFFEMLGNFSFKDYYKKEVIEFAHKFLTENLKMNKNKLFYTCHAEDNEAYEIARKIVGERIIKINTKDNFWQAGEIGPCGYCFEIYYNTNKHDLTTEEAGNLIKSGDPSLLEIWNLVFIGYNMQNNEKIPLKDKYIDCGAGLERIVSVLDGTFDNFQTDLLKPIVEIAKLYTNNETDARIVSDFTKSSSFLVSEGLRPGPTGRNYVLRKLMRTIFQICSNFKPVIEVVCKTMYDTYPSLEEHVKEITKSFEEEHYTFKKEVLSKIEDIKGEINEEQAANLYQTHGIPILLLKNMFPTLDLSKIKEFNETHSEKSKQKTDVDYNIPTKFHYDLTTLETKIVFISEKDEQVEKSSEKEVLIVTQESNFYARGGGQEGDEGTFQTKNASGVIYNTTRKKITATDFVIVHFCKITNGFVSVNDIIKLNLNVDLRLARTRAHSATHIAFESLLRDGMSQNGSFVDNDYLRIDIVNNGKEIDLDKIVLETNNAIIANIESRIYEQEISKINDILMTDKSNYGTVVRVVEFPGYSKQLCGGTHVKRTGDIGFFIIVKTSSIGNNTRRIEAYTGKRAVQFALENQKNKQKAPVEKIKEEKVVHSINTIKIDDTTVLIDVKGVCKNNDYGISIINKFEKEGFKKIAVVFQRENEGTGLIIKEFDHKLSLFKNKGFIGGGKGLIQLFSKEKFKIEQIKEILIQ